jgi:hypothetical protein
MNIDPLIASLPDKTAAERRTIRSRAMTWADSGSDTEKSAACKVLNAFANLGEREATSDPATKVERAFTAIPLTGGERDLIQVVLDHPGADSTVLSEAMGWQDKAWQLHFGKIGWDRQEYLWPAPWAEKRNAPFKAGILADFDEATSGFTVKPEVAVGLARIGIGRKP